jgi:hypothetical protein
VKRHGSNNNHIGYTIVDLTENYVIITCHYKWAGHEAKNIGIELIMGEESKNSNSDEKQNLKLKYTFMGWDSQSLPPIACEDEFPA